jgi:hypothetical protein
MVVVKAILMIIIIIIIIITITIIIITTIICALCRGSHPGPPRRLGLHSFGTLLASKTHDAKICLHLGDAMTAWTKMELEELQ